MSGDHYQQCQLGIQQQPLTWLVTGCAGFVGSNLVESLLKLEQKVIGIDNYYSGCAENIREIESGVTRQQWQNFTFMRGDITDKALCYKAMETVDMVLHHAAIASVPFSIENPELTHDVNVNGTLNLLLAARDAKVKRFVYASSSAVYGDEPSLPKNEIQAPQCLSPYSVSKIVNEQYAEVFQRCYQLSCVGLRYFNIFGPRQHVNSQYGSVIPAWINALINQQAVTIYGDGENTRDFCYIDNVIQANILAALNPTQSQQAIFNIATGEPTSLNSLYEHICQLLRAQQPDMSIQSPIYRDFRQADIRYSYADIKLAGEALYYEPQGSLALGLTTSLQWYLDNAE